MEAWLRLEQDGKRIKELEACLMSESEKRDLLSKEHYRDRIKELEAQNKNQAEQIDDDVQRIAELEAVVAEMGEDTRLGNQAIGYGTVVISNYLERLEEILREEES